MRIFRRWTSALTTPNVAQRLEKTSYFVLHLCLCVTPSETRKTLWGKKTFKSSVIFRPRAAVQNQGREAESRRRRAGEEHEEGELRDGAEQLLSSARSRVESRPAGTVLSLAAALTETPPPHGQMGSDPKQLVTALRVIYWIETSELFQVQPNIPSMLL